MELQKLIDGLKAHKSGAASYESVDEAIRVFEAMRDVDGEKVRDGLECCIPSIQECQCVDGCPYYDSCWSVDDEYDPMYLELMRDALTLIRQQQERIKELEAAQKWISVKDRLPESGKKVLATCEIRSLYGYKKQYVCEAYYAEDHSISEGKYPEDTDCYDYSEEADEYYLKEGWYEVIHNWDEYGSVVICDFVTHWMPLPEPPKEEEHADGA